MIKWICSKITQQNQWYDSLADENRKLRFLLFLTPMMMGLTVDVLSAVFGGPAVFTYLAFALMALWRLPYVMSQKTQDKR